MSRISRIPNAPFSSSPVHIVEEPANSSLIATTILFMVLSHLLVLMHLTLIHSGEFDESGAILFPLFGCSARGGFNSEEENNHWPYFAAFKRRFFGLFPKV
jgi:hypothetical protein